MKAFCVVCGTSFIQRASHRIVCSYPCSAELAKLREAAARCKRGPTKLQAARLAILYRDGWTCGYCGRELKRKIGKNTSERLYSFSRAAVVDHIIPRGHPLCTSEPQNLIAACLSCNSAKSNRRLSPTLKKQVQYVASKPIHYWEPAFTEALGRYPYPQSSQEARYWSGQLAL